MDFGSILKKLRTEKNITQEELAKVLNVSRPTIGRYEINERFPDQENLVKLSKFFNVSIDYLLGLTDIKEPINELIKKGEVSIKPPSDIERIYESLPDEEKKMFNDYAKYLETRAKLNQGDKESSATSEAI
ncbi:helix-turn-helix domain-containing protein [Lutispora thermophila]|uniref:Transcriptional regulator, contains XRE-family HTH domain n=1 Tax=Lutispora thermophila DSM 19022 TaxID=1122184 RepID=A0A1M6J992_9FIRM|nr:helix-turn-helix transcriptional regulator [Lutispora thermophila]SHJ43220.1 Transcriptional regulator, contains XRE-family HTH domain [Lutispora thermophila DSM 19022]